MLIQIVTKELATAVMLAASRMWRLSPQQPLHARDEMSDASDVAGAERLATKVTALTIGVQNGPVLPKSGHAANRLVSLSEWRGEKPRWLSLYSIG